MLEEEDGEEGATEGATVGAVDAAVVAAVVDELSMAVCAMEASRLMIRPVVKGKSLYFTNVTRFPILEFFRLPFKVLFLDHAVVLVASYVSLHPAISVGRSVSLTFGL